MDGPVGAFLREFTTVNSATRAVVLHRVVAANQDNIQITNLLANVNLNDVSPRNRTKPDSIYFICMQLLAFPDFKLR